eukprot:Gb_32890 [translate_table: standard]
MDSIRDEGNVLPETHFSSTNEEVEVDFVDWRGRPPHPKKSGGVKAATFVFVAQAFDVMAITAVQNNLITYLYRDMHFSVAKSANTVTSYVGTANLLALPGGFVSDSFLNRFTTMAIFAAVELMGYILLTVQAYFPSLKPPSCSMESQSNQCQEAHGIQSAVLLLALYLIALGSGFMKSNLLAHGADQFDQRIPEKRKKMSKFFNWSYFGVCSGSLIALTLLVWVQDNIGRYWGFGISATVMFMAFVGLLSGTALYRNKVPKGSPLTRILQVFVAAFKNRRSHLMGHQKPAATTIPEILQKDRLRFLDKAAIEHENKSGPWHTCSIDQVEETKSFIRILPIFGSTIVMNCAVAQLQTFSVQQGSMMKSRLGHNFNVPPASLAAVPLMALLFIVPLYDLFFVPFARHMTGHPTGIPTLQRTGLGLVLSAASMAVAAIVESKRRSHTIKLSILYLLPQFFLSSFSEFFTRVGLVEFFYGQSPPQMRSMSVALNSCSVALGYFLSSLLVSLTNRVTMKTKTTDHLGGWLSSNDLNKDHLDRFYWLLCALSVINFFNYVFWAMSYRYQTNANLHPNGSTINEFENNFITNDNQTNQHLHSNKDESSIDISDSNSITDGICYIQQLQPQQHKQTSP